MMKSVFLNFLCFVSVFSSFGQEKIEVFFDFNKSDLNPSAIATLNDWILKSSDYKVLKIYGFCDWKGTNEYNDSLSLQRVQTVFDYLTEHKIQIDSDYLIKGFGKNFTQDKNQALNRKVIIYYSLLVPKPVEKKPEETLSDKMKLAKKGDLVNLKNIHFYNNSAQVVPKSKSVLYDLLCVMQENPKLKIEIQGHVCCQTSNRMDHISSARAKFIYNYLIQNKIKRDRLTYKGYGVSKPIHPIPEQNETQENENRRVEIKILDN